MSAEVTSPHAIDDETLAAFADGRLDDHERAVVRAHLGGCAECRDTLNLIAGAQDEDIIPRQATVIRGGRFRRYAPWLAAAAAAVVIVSLPPVQGQIAYYRTAGVSKLVKESDHLTVRKQQARLSGGFPHKRFQGAMRGPGRESSSDQEGPLLVTALQLQAEIPENTTSVRKLRALAFAHLFDGNPHRAVETMERAVEQAGEPDANLLSDLSAMYLERARFTGDDDGRDAAAALQNAQRAWQMEKQPEFAWNLALAYEALEGRYEALERQAEALESKKNAIAIWNEYLKLDPSSSWAAEARQHIVTLSTPEDPPVPPEGPHLPRRRPNPTAEN